MACLNEPDSGSIIKSRHSQVGYLPQEGIHVRGRRLIAVSYTHLSLTGGMKQGGSIVPGFVMNLGTLFHPIASARRMTWAVASFRTSCRCV